MKILLPVDGSPYTKCMLTWLANHEEWLNNPQEYTILTVVPLIPPHAASMLSAEHLGSYYEDTAEAVFEPIRNFITKHELAATYVGKTGHASDVIAKIADEGKYDLIVMGSHGHGNLLNLVLGSVATQVLARCKVPVLLVR
jgi:nucleotide-binding universal stress UspA family protein